MRNFVNTLASDLRTLVPDNSPFQNASASWSGRIHPGTEYIAYTANSDGTITVDLTGETGTWQLFAWDADDPSASLQNMGQKSAGSRQTWNLSHTGEVAVRVVKVGATDLVSPAPPLHLEIQ